MNMLPAVNVRLNHHDGNVAPHVSLGRSYVDRLPVPAESRTAAQILVGIAMPPKPNLTRWRPTVPTCW
ncbi:hypothetical protein FOHLNKBM_6214 [Methylobacterium longum]|nr:hypothetical protein FOHLNKBM_6214 [Methylobacterium longum]